MSSKSYESDGARLSYREVGQRVPVVFLHPTPLDHRYWIPLVCELAGVRAVLPDLRGHGESELGGDLPVGGFSRVPDAPVLSMDRLAADVLALLDHLETACGGIRRMLHWGLRFAGGLAAGPTARAGYGVYLLEGAA